MLPTKLGELGAIQPSDMIRTFTNPICKETYNSLPKIYGRKKRKTRLLTETGNETTTLDGKNRTKSQHYYSANEANAKSMVRKTSVK